MTSAYLKGKDIKVNGDCLVYCFIRNIENISGIISNGKGCTHSPMPPEEFDKW